MRVMVIVKSSASSEAGAMPSVQLMADMGRFNKELVQADDFGEALTPELRTQEDRLRYGT